MFRERQAGIFLSYFMHVERDAWLNEVCMGWKDERKARIIQICHVPVSALQRTSKVTLPKPPKNWEPAVAARYRGMIRKVRLVMDVVKPKKTVARAGWRTEDRGVVYNEKETVCALVLAIWDVLETLSSKKRFSGCEVEVEIDIVGSERLESRDEVLDGVRLLLKPFELYAGKLNVSFKSLVTLDQPLNKRHPRFVLVRDGALTDELTGSDDQASQRLAGCLKEWKTKVSGEVQVEANKYWKFPDVVKTCRSLDKSLCDFFGSYSTTHIRLRQLELLSSQAKMMVAEGNLLAFWEAWTQILSLLYEIDDELKNQAENETGRQHSLEQSPLPSLKSSKQKQNEGELLRNKLLKLMARAQAMLKGHSHNAELEIE